MSVSSPVAAAVAPDPVTVLTALWGELSSGALLAHVGASLGRELAMRQHAWTILTVSALPVAGSPFTHAKADWLGADGVPSGSRPTATSWRRVARGRC